MDEINKTVVSESIHIINILYTFDKTYLYVGIYRIPIKIIYNYVYNIYIYKYKD